MEYSKKYPTFNVFKNYIFNDPLCDWFEMNSNIFKKDKITYYVDYIKKEAINYKINILKKIKELSGIESLPLDPSFNTTKELIYNDSELILQGKLLNKDNVFVKCDIIITYSFFKKIFPKINNIPFHLYCTNDKIHFTLK